MTAFCISAKPEGPTTARIRLKCQAEAGWGIRLIVSLCAVHEAPARSRGTINGCYTLCGCYIPRWLLQEKEATSGCSLTLKIPITRFLCVFENDSVLTSSRNTSFELFTNSWSSQIYLDCALWVQYFSSSFCKCILPWGLFLGYSLSMLFCFSSLPITWMRSSSVLQ